ncbi:glycosyltransferase [Erythrobacter sp. 3-20A1M]|uniref:glycosyltransferase family 4 protein n=1 Tax=Erythrobacter sp. 3-20A1M TaxID=2653850 RepID=UPI001BFC8D45|nr:glycosyltransferase family 4 protein [Erythrobacter sp. 3-20A1M]QWC57595.1 glycosyltransferase [Erythrobacter sp. 3-20A1M]
MRPPSVPSLPRVLHLHSSFAAGGKELRSVRLINAFGPKLRHTIVSGVPGELGAAGHIAREIKVDFPDDFPSLQGAPMPGRLWAIAEEMKSFDLVLTYNWGAMDGPMAHTLFHDRLDLPPLIHHEDGFDEDERKRLKTRRNIYRKLALGKTSGLVVASEVLEGIALERWDQPMGRVKHIPNGVPARAFAKRPRADALPGVIKRDGEFWVGTMAGLHPVKNLPLLVRAFAALPDTWQLVIVGDGPEKNAIRAEAERLDIGHRLHMPGFVPEAEKYVGLFDIFALSSDTEQFPLSVVEAMAAGVPVAAPAVGDIPVMVADANAPYIAPAGDEPALVSALSALARDPALRKSIGAANRERAQKQFDEKMMIDAYRRLYGSAMGVEL